MSSAAADSNDPAQWRLTVELKDGSRVIGQSTNDTLQFHSTLLGDLNLGVKDLRTIECVNGTNATKVETANGDTLVVDWVNTTLPMTTVLGNVSVPVAAVVQVTVSSNTNPAITHDGLVGCWSGESSEVTLSGGAKVVPGKLGLAFSFDGVNGSGKIPPSPDLNLGGQATVEFWMKADPGNLMDSYQGLVASDNYVVEIARGRGGRMGVDFSIMTNTTQPGYRNGGPSYMGSGRVLSADDFANTADANGGGTPVSAGQWHHVAATYDGGKLQLYIDGQPSGYSQICTGIIVPMLAGSYVSLGSEDGRTSAPACVGTRYFNGMIDDVAIYSRALTPDEIQADYNAGK